MSPNTSKLNRRTVGHFLQLSLLKAFLTCHL